MVGSTTSPQTGGASSWFSRVTHLPPRLNSTWSSTGLRSCNGWPRLGRGEGLLGARNLISLALHAKITTCNRLCALGLVFRAEVRRVRLESLTYRAAAPRLDNCLFIAWTRVARMQELQLFSHLSLGRVAGHRFNF